jgi:glutathione peroxidase-family protein
LQELWIEFHDRGLMIIGAPSNGFGGQDPGGAAEIRRDGAASIRRYLSDRRKSRNERAE